MIQMEKGRNGQRPCLRELIPKDIKLSTKDNDGIIFEVENYQYY